MSLASSLLALQQADSFFPGGAVAWSWGLESLVADGQLTATPPPNRRQRGQRLDRSAEVLGFVEGQLSQRWAGFDRAYLSAAWHAAHQPSRLYELDGRLQALTLAKELRDGSRRVGQSLLGVHAALGTPGAAHYQAGVLTGQTPGHLPIVQGLLWRQLGMDHAHCQLAAAHALCTGLVSAALRLGVLGHLDAQVILTRLQPRVLQVLAEPAPPTEHAGNFTPMAEIAVMRHETQDLRLFAN